MDTETPHLRLLLTREYRDDLPTDLPEFAWNQQEEEGARRHRYAYADWLGSTTAQLGALQRLNPAFRGIRTVVKTSGVDETTEADNGFEKFFEVMVDERQQSLTEFAVFWTNQVLPIAVVSSGPEMCRLSTNADYPPPLLDFTTLVGGNGRQQNRPNSGASDRYLDRLFGLLNPFGFGMLAVGPCNGQARLITQHPRTAAACAFMIPLLTPFRLVSCSSPARPDRPERIIGRSRDAAEKTPIGNRDKLSLIAIP